MMVAIAFASGRAAGYNGMQRTEPRGAADAEPERRGGSQSSEEIYGEKD